MPLPPIRGVGDHCLLLFLSIAQSRSMPLPRTSTRDCPGVISSFNRSVALNAFATHVHARLSWRHQLFQSLSRAQCFCHHVAFTSAPPSTPLSLPHSRSLPFPPTSPNYF